MGSSIPVGDLESLRRVPGIVVTFLKKNAPIFIHGRRDNDYICTLVHGSSIFIHGRNEAM